MNCNASLPDIHCMPMPSPGKRLHFSDEGKFNATITLSCVMDRANGLGIIICYSTLTVNITENLSYEEMFGKPDEPARGRNRRINPRIEFIYKGDSTESVTEASRKAVERFLNDDLDHYENKDLDMKALRWNKVNWNLEYLEREWADLFEQIITEKVRLNPEKLI